MRDLKKKGCHDCSAAPGTMHQPGCDVEQCAVCGRQAIGCGCPSKECEALPRLPWAGVWPGVKECQELGLYAKFVEGRGWVRTTADDPGAKEDLNRLAAEGVWDKGKACFVSVD